MKKNIKTSAFCWGLAVHFKAYPIIYLPGLLMFLEDDHVYGTKNNKKKKEKKSWFWTLLNYNRIIFSLISGGTFLILLALFYYMYGWEFIYETYLYHLVRKDNRHNFSIYFYDLYLSSSFTNTTNVMPSMLPTLPLSKLAFLPQLITSSYVGFKYGYDLPFCMLMQTMIFVTFNKVCTAQYFLWYFCLAPCALEQSTMQIIKHGVPIIGLWLLTYVHWLYWGYQLEFKGNSVFFELWCAGVFFFLVNVGIIMTCLNNHMYATVFDIQSNGECIDLTKYLFNKKKQMQRMKPMTHRSEDGNDKNDFLYSVGNIVKVESRMYPGMNAVGGVGRITQYNVDEDTCNVKYVLGGSERNVPIQYIAKHVVVTKVRSRTPSKSKSILKKGKIQAEKGKEKKKKIKKKLIRSKTPKHSPSQKWRKHLPKIGRKVEWKFGDGVWYTGVVKNVDREYVTVIYEDENYQHKVNDCWPKAGRWRYHK